MKGLQFLLQSLGINIDPVQIELAFQQGKDSLPKIAQAFDELNYRMARMEANQLVQNATLELLLSRSSGEAQPDPIHESELAGVSASELQNAFVNGAPELVVRNGR